VAGSARGATLFAARGNQLRARHEHGHHHRVTFVELFFDLVFVFAVTQLSHGLVANLTVLGVVQNCMLMLGVWWLWMFTCWATNWLDPDKPAVRMMLFALMLAGLVLSASIPRAFEERGLPFALAYVFIQVGRTAFMLWALKNHDQANFRNFQRIAVWLGASALFWLAGGLVDGSLRLALWGLALAIEYASPILYFRVPGLGRSTTADWRVEGGHMAERCGLFIIIALGESILITGATFANLPWTATTVAAFVVAFIGSVALWVVYFNIGAERSSQQIAASDDPGRFARSGYTYMHLPIVAGIIVAAVADELVLHHPSGHDGHTDTATATAIIGGPALYLFGNALFKRLSAPYLPLSHLIGLALLALLMPVAEVATPLVLSAGATVVLIVVAVWEWQSVGRGRPADARP
jgi:low temperature requirement protein LtrA